MKFKLYAAPINVCSNKAYRNLLLKHSADYVFSELIRIDKLEIEEKREKFEVIKGDESKTIWQIGVSNKQEIDEAIKVLKSKHKEIYEININMGCPHSSLEKRKYCSGILNDTSLMKELTTHLTKKCHKENNNINNNNNTTSNNSNNILASVKIRIGTRHNHNRIKEYLDILNKTNIDKVYIHMRYLTYNYTKPALYDWLENSIKNKEENYDKKKLDLSKYKFEIILNGDIDSYEKCNNLFNKFKTDKFHINSFLIGRSSLHNPLIFEDIKNKEKQNKEIFDPIHNNVHLIKKDMSVYLSNKQKIIINEFIEISKKNNLRPELIKANLGYILKGVDGKEKEELLKIILLK